MQWDTVAIVGVGLIGGSIGLALRDRELARNVVGIGRRELSLRRALDAGAVTATTTDIAAGVAGAQLVIVCTPVGLIPAQVRVAARHAPEGAIITDAGSTKEKIVAAAEGSAERNVQFIGSHPLAGSEKTGPEHARGDLFSGRTVVVTPIAATSAAATQTIRSFWESLGAKVVEMSPAAHDEAVAAISHLPHLAAATLAAATPSEHLFLAATGFADTTRVAAGDPELWRQIVSDNRSHVLNAVERFEKVLAQLKSAVAAGDDEALLEILSAGKQKRDAVAD